MKIFVVDDDVLIREYIVKCIENIGNNYNVVGNYSSGDNAFFEINKLNPDLIITDIKMPKMSGLELLEKVKKENSKTNVVMLTCYSDFEIVRSAIQLNADDYILKSEINENTMLKILERVEEKQRQIAKDVNSLKKYIDVENKNFYGEIYSEKNYTKAKIDLNVEFQKYINLSSSFVNEKNSKGYVEILEEVIIYCEKNTPEENIVKNTVVSIFKSQLNFSQILIEEEVGKIILTKNFCELKNIVKDFIEKILFETKSYSAPIQNAITYIKNNFDQNISLNFMANLVFLSSEYFSRQFKKEIGVNFSDYLIDIRMQKAKILLETTNKKVGEVAFEVGFGDSSHFSVVFRKKFGKSPLEIRKGRF